MKSKFLLFLLCANALIATVNEPLRMEIFSGYRNDRIHWHLQNPGGDSALTYTQLIRDAEFWENGVAFKVIHRDLSFGIRGSYSTFGTGKQFSNDIAAQTTYSTTGWEANGSGYFGYAVNLTADRVYKVIFTPIIGYSADWEQLKTKGSSDGATTVPGTFHLTWRGFQFGAFFLIEPNNRFVLNAGYAYQLLHNSMRQTFSNPSKSFSSSSNGNPGQTGWLQLDFLLAHLWRIGIGGDIHYFTTRVVDGTMSQTDVEDFEQKLKLRWTSVSAWMQICKEF